SVNSVLSAISQCQPDMGGQLDDYAMKIGTGDESTARRSLYEKSNPISIDFAVLESAENVLAIKADMVWDDVGSWNALERYKNKDMNNNVIIGNAKVADSYETTIYNETDGIIVTLGVSDLVVVKTDDIVLVAHKTKVNEVKQVIKELSQEEAHKKYL
ncbi:MAG: mannose-1-phosphate guanylyltransferase, partial [Candidatus Zixiibacteriota bacterium]